MLPFLDRSHFYTAIDKHALPMLGALAANDCLYDYSLCRFKRDDPLPYTSLTESEDFNDDDFFA